MRRIQAGIHFIVWADSQGRIREFELSGHAGFAEEGQDIVCAGVSALSIAAINGLEYFLSVVPKVQEAEGHLTCQLGGVAEQELEKAQWILQTMKLGIEQIQMAYGQDYIFIDRRRWTPC
ncbi:50S ribosomal subunit protein L27 specific N-terminal end cysteine protease [Candidatus Desulfosporosinus infrequens]|uniref:Ribosomal processing cysteine protease Prp n=1 Tax=Candidatus Desulfosporosinus infrequens TaxID=2043169 RepID=A0A2U3KW23_9FIRM|nr:50S ribosomal subunit protein L27 specific N-terminal end cysteine protease [Candidatus Desulfosporosinus infrequens]